MVGKIIGNRFVNFVTLAFVSVFIALMTSGLWWLMKYIIWHEHLDFLLIWKWTSIILVAVELLSVLIVLFLDAYQGMIIAHKYGVSWREAFEAFARYHFHSTGDHASYGAPEFRQWLKTQQSKS